MAQWIAKNKATISPSVKGFIKFAIIDRFIIVSLS